MTRICWWFINRMSRLLDSNERDAVLGDITERGEAAGSALFDIIGLVVRRQIGYWKEWQPWAALLGVVAPMGILLGLVCRQLGEGSATTLYMYVNGWTWAYLESPGARQDLFHNIGWTLFAYLALICWSWASGFVIGSLSRRAVGVNGALFAFLLFGEALLIPQYHNPYNPLVWSFTFYRVVYPLLLRAVLILLPVLWGMKKAFRNAALPPFQTIFAGVIIAIVTGLEALPLAVSIMAGWVHLHAAWELRLVPVVVAWPAVFMIATAKWRRRTLQVSGCALILCIVTVVPVLSHTYTGGLTGVIRNPSGGRIANAVVIATKRATNVDFRTNTDKWGTYKLTRLPMGKYDLTVERQGFEEAVRKNIPVTIAGTRAVNFSLTSRVSHRR